MARNKGGREKFVQLKNDSGFTVIEMLVSVGIIMVLSGIAIGYNRLSTRYVAVHAEQAKLAGVLTRAKTLALQRYNAGGENPPCAFGIKFNGPASYTLFEYPSPPGDECDFNVLEGSENPIETFTLHSGIQFSSYPFRIFFEPPYIVAHIRPANKNKITLEVVGVTPQVKASVEVTTGGGITLR